jgi:pyruvate dehydrogenase E1 component alpha subunit
MQAAATRARAGKGPTLLELETYRFCGHSRSDPGHYRPKEEIEFWKGRDPLDRYEAFCVNEKVIAEKEVAELKASVEKELDEAVAFAQASPNPEPEDVYNDVYAV